VSFQFVHIAIVLRFCMDVSQFNSGATLVVPGVGAVFPCLALLCRLFTLSLISLHSFESVWDSPLYQFSCPFLCLVGLLVHRHSYLAFAAAMLAIAYTTVAFGYVSAVIAIVGNILLVVDADLVRIVEQ
jgi:predicted membrane-bound mannosyltransferase